jgi:hypothetical protein
MRLLLRLSVTTIPGFRREPEELDMVPRVKATWKRVAVALIMALVLATLTPHAVGGTGGHPSNGGTTYVPPPPPKPFYLKPAWMKRIVPFHGSTKFTGVRRWAVPAYIVSCESGGDYRVENPASSASGAYQILDSTWYAYGGGRYAGRARDAEYWQQDHIAHRIWVDVGASAWSCG